MTKEELKQEAEESFEQYKVTDEDYVVSPYSDDMGEKMLMYNYEYYAEETYLRLYTQGYLTGSEPREKQIEIDAEQIRALQKQNGKLTDKVKKLEAQIEEMKCCHNCANFMISGKCPGFFRTGWCKNWEMTK